MHAPVLPETYCDFEDLIEREEDETTDLDPSNMTPDSDNDSLDEHQHSEIICEDDTDSDEPPAKVPSKSSTQRQERDEWMEKLQQEAHDKADSTTDSEDAEMMAAEDL